MSRFVTVECLLCPTRCVLAPFDRGACGVRVNVDGRLQSLVYGRPCAVHVDPIEKKPLFHFMPGSKILSLATVGCCLECKFCQNWQISQARPEEARSFSLPPDEVPALARKRDCRAIAYTYTEPTVFFEYMIDTARKAREEGLRNVNVTCGYICREPLDELCGVLDGANVDLKAYSERFYREVCGGRLRPVLDTLVRMKERGVWLEVTNLIVPTLNDSDGDLRRLCRWHARNLGRETPLHFSRFRPDFRLRNLPPTPLSTLIRAREIARAEGLRFIYVGNALVDEGGTTRCPSCGKIVVQRRGYEVIELRLQGNRCARCGATVSGRWCS